MAKKYRFNAGDGIRADIVTEPCVSALSKAVPKEEI